MDRIDIKYKVTIMDVKTYDYGIENIKKRVVIFKQYILSEELSVEIPSCINSYIIKLQNKSINYIKSSVNTIASFLNFVIDKNKEKEDETYKCFDEKGLYALTLKHAADFLNFCIVNKKLKGSTIRKYAWDILRFYSYLSENNIIAQDDLLDKYIKTAESPFDSLEYIVYFPRKTNVKLNKLVNMDKHLWESFLNISKTIDMGTITFAIALQFFGGLRKGEIVNLSISDIKLSRNNNRDKLDVTIKDRSEEYFGWRPEVDISECKAKKLRNQTVFNFNGNLYTYYENHIKLRNKQIAKGNIDTMALFINKEGLPMTGYEYKKIWKKVKNKFMKYIQEESYIDYLFLKKYNWSTHIGRGIFTNLCLEYDLAKNAKELANLRGDFSELSAQPYIDEFKKIKTINKSFEKISEERLNKKW